MSLSTFLAIGLGGFTGALLRAYLTGVFNKLIPFHSVAVGTLSVNILGSLLMGMLFAFFTHTSYFSPTMKSFLSTGLLGALTTYSTFALESFIMLQHGQYGNFAMNVGLNVIGTIVTVMIGFIVVTYFLK